MAVERPLSPPPAGSRDGDGDGTDSTTAAAILGGAGPVSKGKGPAAWAERIGGIWTLGVLIALVLGFGFVAPNFYSRDNWLATSQYAVEFMLLALGQTFVIITAGIDLADGAMLGISSMVAALLMSDLLGGHSGSPLITAAGFAAGLATGTVVGVVNGLIITKMKLTPFIATLGTLGMATGATFLLNGGAEVSNLPSQVAAIGNTVLVGWLPIPVLVAAFFCLVTWLLLSRTRFGLRTYAIGSNETAARRAGINVDRHLVWVYVISGFLSGVAGLLVMSRFSVGNPLAGANDELDAIAAVVIGGASLFGGRGTIAGTIIGTFVISVLVTGLVLAHVQPFWQQVAVGAVLIGAVWADQIRGRLRQR
ncbi:MAG: ABC transporter permease [Acidimicrobiales bacterium]